MKARIAVLLFAFFVMPVVGYSQERVPATPPHATRVPAEVRFEVVQVNHMREAFVLRLDKYTGEVYELARNRDLVREKGQPNAWQITRWSGQPAPEGLDSSRVNFQVFSTSSNNEGTAFLININTGDAWALYREQTPEKELTWVPIKTQRR